MTKSKVLLKDEAKQEVIKGVDILADAVGTSLGPRGRNVGISRTTPAGEVYERLTLHDGVSIAKAIDLENEAQQFGVSIVREAAQKTVGEVGDATTATIVLARAIIKKAQRQISSGVNPMALREEIERDRDKVLKFINDNSKEITTLQEKIQVATISSEEEELGKLIGETVHDLGSSGVITVEKSKSGETFVEKQEGMQWDRGYASPYFITDPDTGTATLENTAVLVTDLDLVNMQYFLPFLEDTLKHTKFITIIAPEFGGDVLLSLIQNKMEGRFLALCIKAPGFGDNQEKILQDIAILTGGTFISKNQGHILQDIRFEHTGRAERISASNTTTLISGGGGSKDSIDGRVKELKKSLSKETSDFDKEKLRERIAKLTNGVAVIKVGGATDVEIKERYERALDAALATRQAVKGGIIQGGETAYLRVIHTLSSNIMREALEIPFKLLVENAGHDGGVMLERIRPLLKKGYGIDVRTGKVVNLLEKGIIDPANVLKSAITNAVSVALQIITTEGLIYPEEKKK